MKKFVFALMAAALLAASGAAFAAYPEGPITVVVPYGAGGAMDITARLFAKYAEKICGQPVVVTNVPGGSGSVGAMDVLKSRNGGYKVLIFDPGPGFVTTKTNKVPFNTVKDFMMAGRQTSDVRVIAVRAGDERYANAEQFFAYVKANPGKVNVATPGARTDGSISLTLLNRVGGFEMVNLPCSGANEAKSNLLGGHVDAAGLSISDCLPLIADKKIVVIGICDAQRNAMMPDVPTFRELGVDVVWKTSRGYGFKKGTDPEIVAYFDELIKKVSENPDYATELKNIGCPVDYLGREEYTKYVEQNLATIAEILNK